MSFDYASIRTDALELIKDFAGSTRVLSILRTVEGAASDPDKPWRVTSGTILEFRFQGEVIELSPPHLTDQIPDREVKVIVPGDIELTGAETAPSTLCGEITSTDRIQDGSVQYAIIGRQRICPDDKAICYILKGKAWPNLIKQPASPV